jgi:propionyl-CoA synthetase
MEEAMTTCKAFYRRSIEQPEAFWSEQAQLIDWHRPFDRVLDYDRPPFTRWFAGGETNLCHNALDRHLATRGDQNALVYISTETGTERHFTFRELLTEVKRSAAVLRAEGVGRGDRVLIYMPMIPEAVFMMLACARLGAIHSVVFGGFASHNLALRIDDAQPKVMVTADAGMRGGKVIPYGRLVEDALKIAQHPPARVIVVNRGLTDAAPTAAGRDADYAVLRAQHMDEDVAVTWLEANEPSYILYTSGTTGKPKGVQRDTGGHAVALAASMKYIYGANPGETMFTTSDIGWVVGHSYIVYGPLLYGMTTILYEGLPIRPDPGIWWKIVSEHKVSVMFSSPTAIRVLKKQDPAYLKKYDVSALRYVFLAGEPLDEPTNRWLAEALGAPVLDHYWQTETGWTILGPTPGVEALPAKFGSPSFPVYGYNVKLLREDNGEEVGANEKGVVAVVPPLPPGCLSTVWGDDERFVHTYFNSVPGQLIYSTFDWGLRDADGYYFILGRTDDVINVAGHRLGTREIEEAISSHPNVAEVAVVGIRDAIKGQAVAAFIVARDAGRTATADGTRTMRAEIVDTVDRALGPVARPAHVMFVTLLPKTRSGKLLRRSIQALAEGRDPGDLATVDDPAALEQVRTAADKLRAESAEI